MIYVRVEGEKSEGRGRAGGNDWYDTDDVEEAVRLGLAQFHRMWDHLGHGAIETYRIVVATEASPRRTKGRRRAPAPLPVGEGPSTELDPPLGGTPFGA